MGLGEQGSLLRLSQESRHYDVGLARMPRRGTDSTLEATHRPDTLVRRIGSVRRDPRPIGNSSRDPTD